MEARQIPLDLPVASAQSRDDLLVTPANAMAVGLIDAWPDWPGNLTILAGPPGSGKSHLANIWAGMAQAQILQAGRLEPESIQRIQNLVLEDATAGQFDERVLFHAINDIKARGGHCLIISGSAPGEWQVRLPDLASRLRSAQLIRLNEPDDELLRLVLFKLFADRQLTLRPGVAEYILRRTERSLAAIRHLVDRLDREALARNSPISQRIAAGILNSASSPPAEDGD